MQQKQPGDENCPVFFAQIFGGVKYIVYLCHHENETPVSLKSILREMDAPRVASHYY